MNLTAAEFNAKFPVGTAVFYWSVLPARPEFPPRETTTRSEAWTLGDGHPVVQIEGLAGCVSLLHVEESPPLPLPVPVVPSGQGLMDLLDAMTDARLEAEAIRCPYCKHVQDLEELAEYDELMTICTYCGGPGAPKPGVMCSACIDRFEKATAPPPLSDEAAAKLRKFCSRTPPRPKDSVILVDDLEADCPVEPGHREKVLEHYDDFVNAFGGPADGCVVLDGPAAEATTNAVLSLFSCGPSTIPCGPNYDDHTWDAEEDLYDDAGRVCGGTSKCSKCGLPAIDYDIGNAE